jgi:hypothetical protein
MYRIEWTDTARAELRAIWNSAPPTDDQLLLWAVADITFLLQRDPHNEGESRSQGTRILFSRPLAVLFDIPADDTVQIHAIWRPA